MLGDFLIAHKEINTKGVRVMIEYGNIAQYTNYRFFTVESPLTQSPEWGKLRIRN